MYCIVIQKNQFAAGKQMFIKYLTTAKTTVLEYTQSRSADTKNESKTLLHLFFDVTEEAKSWFS